MPIRSAAGTRYQQRGDNQIAREWRDVRRSHPDLKQALRAEAVRDLASIDQLRFEIRRYPRDSK
jgi:hypothetical protein